MARKIENRWKIQKCPLQDKEYGKETENHGTQKHPLDDLKNDENTEKPEKREMYTLGPGIARQLKITKNENNTRQVVKYDKNIEKLEK